jgi:hypothetical protein
MLYFARALQAYATIYDPDRLDVIRRAYAGACEALRLDGDAARLRMAGIALALGGAARSELRCEALQADAILRYRWETSKNDGGIVPAGG